MTLSELITEFTSVRRPGWLVMADPELAQFGLEAVRFYAAYGDIKSLSNSDVLPGAGDTLPSTPVTVVPSLPIKRLELITETVELTPGEWAVIRPLFILYVERENALRLEASRANGLEVYGRSVGEVSADIARQEEEIIPAKAFVYAAETI